MEGKPFPLKWYWVALFLVVTFTVWPIVGPFIAGGVFQLNGCSFDGGTPSQCTILGADLGDALTTIMFQFFYIGYTIPIGICLFILWALALVIHRARFLGNS
ncbi:MAG: hypothetical protein ACK4G5_13575 [Devosia sp.]